MLPIRMLMVTALVAVAAALAPPAAFGADAAPVACEDGVAVVVDFTDLGGVVEVGCAPGAQASGRAALEAAGFTSSDGAAGFICAIDALPDPCPEVFEGSFWAYWHATPGGEWLTYNEGADSSRPESGSVEGWRYNNGATPPGIGTGAVLATGGGALGPTQGSADAQGAADPHDPVDAQGLLDAQGSAALDNVRSATFLGLPVSDLVVLVSFIVAMVVAAVVVQRRRRARSGA